MTTTIYKAACNAAVVADASGASDAGVVCAAVIGHEGVQYVLWAIGVNGQIVKHCLDAEVTSFERLLAHAKGFVEAHQATFH